MTEPNNHSATPQTVVQPPPLPVIPAAGASTPVVRERPNFGQQAARASWMAPLIACVVGVLTFSIRDADRTVGIVIGGINVLIIFAGGVLGIVALLGMGKWGRERVLVPAIVGVVVFILFALSIVATFRAVARVKHAQQQRQQAAAADDAATRKEGEDAFLNHAGWVGAIHHANATVTLVTVPDTAPFVQEMRSNFRTPVSVLVLLVDNRRGGTPVTIDPDGAVVHFVDGTNRPMSDLVLVLRSARTDPRGAAQALGPPLTAEPGKQLAGKFLFLPPATDPSTIDHITLGIEGARVDVPGRFLTPAEKRSLQQAARDQPAVLESGP